MFSTLSQTKSKSALPLSFNNKIHTYMKS